MDEKLEILLNEEKNIESINVDNSMKVELSNKPALINEYNIRNVLSVTELFELEREENQVYRIYGSIEYLSLLNGLKNNYDEFSDFFKPFSTENHKDIFNSFDFYLVRPAESGYTQNINNASKYNRFFKVVATPNQFDIFKVGFNKNVFDEQTYAFNFTIDIDISELRDEFGMPLTELFIYAQYKKSGLETLSFTRWSNIGDITNPTFSAINLNVGEYIRTQDNRNIGDYIEYAKQRFWQNLDTPQTFRIGTPIKGLRIGSTINVVWKYNPFIPIRLRYFEDYLSRANTGSTSYEETVSIPEYATDINNGNFVWREIMSEGYRDPITGIGTDHPFVNKRRYVFTKIILDITPDLEDDDTRNLFQKLWFENDTTLINARPINNINELDKPCL